MSSKPSLYDLMNHPAYLTLTRFIDANGYKIARSGIRSYLKKVKGVFDLTRFHELLTNFFTDMLVIQIDSQIDDPGHIITPCFLLQTKDDQFLTYVVLEIDEEKALIFENDKGDYSISANEFRNLLKGAIIMLKEEEAYDPPAKILKEYNEEQEQNKKYISTIKVIDDFVSEKKCKEVIDFCEENNLFKRSEVGRGSRKKVSDYRTSSSAMMERHHTTPVLEDIKEKVAAFLGCTVNKIEKLQCVRYYTSEEYKPHFDAFSTHANKRRLTCLLYLNEGFSGGETYFPEIAVGVDPKVGRLLIFENLNENDEVITQSFHQGSPIQNGVKYACNIWIEK